MLMRNGMMKLKFWSLDSKFDQIAQDERCGQKMNSRSQDLSMKRLRKECRAALEQMGFLTEVPPVSTRGVEEVGQGPMSEGDCLLHFADFAVLLDRHLDGSAVGDAMRNLPQDTREAVHRRSFRTAWRRVTV